MKRIKVCFVFCVFLLFFGVDQVHSSVIRVNSMISLQQEIDKAVPGKTIIVENGMYVLDKAVTIRTKGLAQKLITITSETVGGVELKGSFGFVIESGSSFIVIKGFKFSHAAGKCKIESGSTSCRFTRNTFECEGKGAYLTVSGDDNQIDYNTFQNKFTEGQMISVQGPGASEMAQRNWIHHNYFYKFAPTANNCGSIQIGMSGRSMSAAYTLVEYNLFSQTRGENENICNKSCKNTYRYNTFSDGVSELSLRHGNGCEVYGNYFLGSEGIRFYGRNHRIYCNYFERCSPAISIGNGDGIIPPDKLVMHDRPDSVWVIFNTLNNNVRNIIMQNRKNGLGAAHIILANNIIQGGNEAVTLGGMIEDVLWENNFIWKTKGPGDLPANGYIEKDPALISTEKEKVHLQKDSPAIGKSIGQYPFVTVDIDGQSLGKKSDVGADQQILSPVVNHVMTLEDAGANATLLQ